MTVRTNQRTLNQRIWAGDPKAVIAARKKYRTNRHTEFVPFMSTLYSFSSIPELRTELLTHRHRLYARAKSIIGADFPDTNPLLRRMADQANVVSTILVWMSQCRELEAEERKEIIRLAFEITQKGVQLEECIPEELRGHTYCLLLLTATEIVIILEKPPERYPTSKYLKLVSERALHIPDANQRARVYRKLGMLYRKLLNLGPGLYWGLKACFVPTTPLAVRFKSVAALAGLKR
jgi:hypothetical protein